MPNHYGNTSQSGPMMPEMPEQQGGFGNFLKKLLMAKLGIQQQQDPSQIQYEQQLKDYYAQMREGRQFENRKDFATHEAGLETPTPTYSPQEKKQGSLDAIIATATAEADKSGHARGSPEYVQIYRYNKALGLKGPGDVIRSGQDDAFGLPSGIPGYMDEDTSITELSPGGMNHDMDPGGKQNWFKKLLGIGSQYQGGL